MSQVESLQGQVINNRDFFSRINREDLRSVLTPQTPWVVYSSEVYLNGYGLPGSGGLGILMGDFLVQAYKLRIPVLGVTLGYPQRWIQEITPDFTPENKKVPIDLEQAGLTKLSSLPAIEIRANGDRVFLDVYRATDGLPLYALSEPGLRNNYADTSNSDHRIYQDSVLGFGGATLINNLGLNPVVNQLNESAVFAVGIAQVDKLIQQGLSLEEALSHTRQKNLFTNHSLVRAASGVISSGQIEQYISKNLSTDEARAWLQGLPRDEGGNLNLGLLSMELAGKFNGVSVLHADIASQRYRRFDNSPAEFIAVTNGIALDRWIAPELYKLYKTAGVYDDFDLPTDDYGGVVMGLSESTLRQVKSVYRSDFREYLRTRKDQEGQPVVIPDNAIIGCWAKRIAGYKRPELLLEDSERLKQILIEQNMHIVISGKAHETDGEMQTRLKQMLGRVKEDEVLRTRVHFIQNYDENFAKKLIPGVDIWFNTPIEGYEACGTSWEKAIANLAILISTEDGGVADIKPACYLKIEGVNSDEEVTSLYYNMNLAANMVRGSDQLWGHQVKQQLRGYAAILSGARMIKDYLNLIPPNNSAVLAAA